MLTQRFYRGASERSLPLNWPVSADNRYPKVVMLSRHEATNFCVVRVDGHEMSRRAMVSVTVGGAAIGSAYWNQR